MSEAETLANQINEVFRQLPERDRLRLLAFAESLLLSVQQRSRDDMPVPKFTNGQLVTTPTGKQGVVLHQASTLPLHALVLLENGCYWMLKEILREVEKCST